MSLSISRAIPLGLGGWYDLRKQFRSGTDGFLFLPKDPTVDSDDYLSTTQWQESTGVTPVLVAETACGLRMDYSQSLVRGGG